MGDYTPCEMDWGQALRFWGNQVRHHTVANTTDSTRVSIDFRVSVSAIRKPLPTENLFEGADGLLAALAFY